MTQSPFQNTRFAVCIQNTSYPAALEIRKMYQLLPDSVAANHGLVRVIDESGEDYLYPAGYFIDIDLPPALQLALSRAA